MRSHTLQQKIIESSPDFLTFPESISLLYELCIPSILSPTLNIHDSDFTVIAANKIFQNLSITKKKIIPIIINNSNFKYEIMIVTLLLSSKIDKNFILSKLSFINELTAFEYSSIKKNYGKHA